MYYGVVCDGAYDLLEIQLYKASCAYLNVGECLNTGRIGQTLAAFLRSLWIDAADITKNKRIEESVRQYVCGLRRALYFYGMPSRLFGHVFAIYSDFGWPSQLKRPT